MNKKEKNRLHSYLDRSISFRSILIVAPGPEQPLSKKRNNSP